MRHTVLIADTDARLLASATSMLEQAGYQVLTASSGEQALAKEREIHPDLVCLDLHMPDLDAVEICRTLKAARNVPVLFTASYLDDATSAGFAQAGAEDLLFKPYDPEELVDKVAWYLAPED